MKDSMYDEPHFRRIVWTDDGLRKHTPKIIDFRREVIEFKLLKQKPIVRYPIVPRKTS